MESHSKRSPGILLLISEDCDYLPIINRALKHHWGVETWFWRSDPFGKDYFLKITDGETIKRWGNDVIIDCLIL
ncbi:hypothetical protein RCL_jg11677.t1 [Rhizophagus clarus]|uniref:NYN domain-containing protein n=1 Tax=Rhizophagus clarus TaxID=94130 RepID=A0A8H3R456_9GLOM|nr:hypothetical protein RCL_jg11677.t1 [Rhizophagus clarus]